ncbi:unnamed protein product [Merluccius merluccius]
MGLGRCDKLGDRHGRPGAGEVKRCPEMHGRYWLAGSTLPQRSAGAGGAGQGDMISIENPGRRERQDRMSPRVPKLLQKRPPNVRMFPADK